jgi:hypothetical protein
MVRGLETKARHRRAGRALVAAAMVMMVGRAAAAVPPAPAHPVEVDRFAGRFPEAGKLARQAEQALAAGRLSEATSLYGEASRIAPGSGFADRRRCELLSAGGQGDLAIQACQLAVQHGGTVLDLRAMVGAVTAQPRPLSLDEVVDVTQMATGAQRQLPGEPYGYAAFADIARRIGDRELLAASLTEMQRRAPDHFETRRALALRPASPRWTAAVGWAVLALLVGAALRRRVPHLTGLRRAVAPAVLLAVLAGRALAGPELPPHAADAPPAPDRFSTFRIDDADPSRSLPTPAQANANPLQFGYLLMDLATRAEVAEKHQDWAGAVRYYQALAQAVPGKSVSYGKMCRAYEALGDRTHGLAACRDALAREGVRVDDHTRYVRLLLDHPGPVTAAERDDVTAIIEHLRKDPATAGAADDVQCQLGARVADLRLLEGCVAGLSQTAPRDARTITYQWALALEKRDLERADQLLGQARAAGVNPATVARMEAAVAARRNRRRLPLLGGGVLLLAGVALFMRRPGLKKPLAR